MDSKELQELVAYIRKSLTYSTIGLDTQQVQQLHQRLDSDSYKAALAVESFFEFKRSQS